MSDDAPVDQSDTFSVVIGEGTPRITETDFKADNVYSDSLHKHVVHISANTDTIKDDEQESNQAIETCSEVNSSRTVKVSES